MKAEDEKRKARLLEYAQRIDWMMRNETSDLIRRMVEERHRKGLSQQNIADATGIAAPNIARFESCKQVPTLQLLAKYADALDMQIRIEMMPMEVIEGRRGLDDAR